MRERADGDRVTGCGPCRHERTEVHRPCLRSLLPLQDDLGGLPTSSRSRHISSAAPVVCEVDRPVGCLPCDAAHRHASDGAQEAVRVPAPLCFEATLRAFAFPGVRARATVVGGSVAIERVAIAGVVGTKLRVLGDATGTAQRPLGIARSLTGSALAQRAGVPRPMRPSLPRSFLGAIRLRPALLARSIVARGRVLPGGHFTGEERPEACFQGAQLTAIGDARGAASRRGGVVRFREGEALDAPTARHELHDHAVFVEPAVQVRPVRRAIDRIEHVGPRGFPPRKLACVKKAPVVAIAEPALGCRRKILQSLGTLHDVAVVPARDDRPAALGRDLGTDPLADHPLAPQIVRPAIGTDAVRDDVRVKVVGIHVRRKDVLVLAHAERSEEPLRIRDHLRARRMLVLCIGDDHVVDRVFAARRQRGDGLHLDRCCFDRQKVTQMDPRRFLRCRRVLDAALERAPDVFALPSVMLACDIGDAGAERARTTTCRNRFRDH